MGGGKEYIGIRVVMMEVYFRCKGLVTGGWFVYWFRLFRFRFVFAFWFFLWWTVGPTFRHGRRLEDVRLELRL